MSRPRPSADPKTVSKQSKHQHDAICLQQIKGNGTDYDRREMDTLLAGAFLVRQFINLLLNFWLVGAIFMVMIIIAAFINRPISRRDLAKSFGYTAFLLTVAFTILLIGAAMHHPTLTHPNTGYQEPSPWVIQATFILLIIHFAASGGFIWQANGYRFFAVALAAFNIWLALISCPVRLSVVRIRLSAH